LVGAGLRLAEDRALGQEEFLSAAHQSAVATVLADVSLIRRAGYDQRLHSDPESIRNLVAGKINPSSGARQSPGANENHLGASCKTRSAKPIFRGWRQERGTRAATSGMMWLSRPRS